MPKWFKIIGGCLLLIFITNTSFAGELERNVKREGRVYKNMALERGDPNLCRDACMKDPKCQSCTYFRPGLMAKKALCWLSSEVGKKRTKAGCVSWVKNDAAVAAQPAATTQPAAPVGHSNFEYNSQRLGHITTNLAIERGDPKLCREACMKDPTCQSFTYFRPGLKGKKAICWLSDNVAAKKSKAGCVSWVKNPSAAATSQPAATTQPAAAVGHSNFEYNSQRLGHITTNLAIERGDPKLCREACMKDPTCQSFTYFRPGLKGKKAICWLSNNVAAKKSKAGCVSWVKNPSAAAASQPAAPARPLSPTVAIPLQYNTDLTGKAVKNLALERGDPGLCREACMKDPTCQAFTYFRPGLKGKKAICWLRKEAGQTKSRAGCVSGIKP